MAGRLASVAFAVLSLGPALAAPPGSARDAAAESEARLAAAAREAAWRTLHLRAALDAAARGLAAAGDSAAGDGAVDSDAKSGAARALAARLTRAQTRALLGLGRAPEAAEALVSLLERDDPAAETLALGAAALLAAGRLAAADEAAGRAISAAGAVGTDANDVDAPPPGARETAPALVVRAHARLRLGRFEDAARDAARAVALGHDDAATQALATWARRRARLPLRGLTTRAVGRFELRSAVSDELSARLADRLSRVAPLFEHPVPIAGDDPRGAPRTAIYLLDPATYGRLGGAAAKARAFYQRDERAVFALAEHEAELARVVVHEAFHAHLHRLVDEAPAWLDEGLADHFAGVRVEDDAAPLFLPHPIRLRDLRIHISAGRDIRLREVARLSRPALYAQRRVAASWGWVAFLAQAGDDGQSPALTAYTRAVLGGASPEEAWRAGFADADVPALERQWRDWVLRQRPPRN
jgi:hypothetical protein